MTQPRAVFFDRDGVLNEAVIDGDAVRGPRSLAELRVRSDAADAVARVRRAGYLPVVVTNQPDVARGKLAVATADAIDRQVRAEVGIDVGYECRHDDDAACECRKPRPGMLLDAARDHDLDLGASWLIGDRWVDVVAARAAGVRPVLLERPWSRRPSSHGDDPPELGTVDHAPTLAACVDTVLGGDPLSA